MSGSPRPLAPEIEDLTRARFAEFDPDVTVRRVAPDLGVPAAPPRPVPPEIEDLAEPSLADLDPDVTWTRPIRPAAAPMHETPASGTSEPVDEALVAQPPALPTGADWDALAEEIRMQVLQRIDMFTDTGLRNTQIYYYIATALDEFGNESGPSNEVAALPHYVIGWANLQWPPTLDHTISMTNRTDNVYGQVWIDGVTPLGLKRRSCHLSQKPQSGSEPGRRVGLATMSWNPEPLEIRKCSSVDIVDTDYEDGVKFYPVSGDMK